MKRIFIFTFFFSLKLLAVTYVIDKPGLYNLGTDITEVGTNVVQIISSDVTLDLNDHTLAGGTNGILINPGLTFITIKNGRIAGIVNNGICIGSNCRNVILDELTILQCGNNAIRINNGLNGAIISDSLMGFIGAAGLSIASGSSSIKAEELNISNCSGPAIEMLGTTTDFVKNSLFEKVTTASCALLATFTHIIRVDYGDNILFNTLSIFTSGNALNDNKLIEFTHCKNCSIRGGLFSGNSAGSLIGLSLNNTDSTVIQNLITVNNYAESGDFTGFLLTNTSPNNLLGSCRVGTSSAIQGHIRGFNIEHASDGIIFNECSVAGLIGEDVTGFDLHTDQLGLYNVLSDCNVFRNVALTGTCVGYSINNANSSTLRNSAGSYNIALSGRAIGLLFTGTGGQLWNINECKFVGNTGLDDANSYGIFVETGTNNLFIQNFAFNNGSTQGNQMNGVPAGSVTQLNPDNLNSADTPWANVVITT